MTILQRLRMTQGQTYSAGITLAAALLLLLGLGNLHGVAGTAIAEQPLPLAPAQPAPVAVPAPSPAAVAFPPTTTLPALGVEPAPEPAPAPVPTFDDPPITPEPRPTPTAEPNTCRLPQLAGPNDTALAALDQVNALSGGRLPAADVKAAIGVVTGCDPADPAVVAVGLLIGIGHALPDPGLPNPAVLPFVAIPPSVVTALQPARPAIDQACGLVGTGQTVTALFISAYPQPVPQLVSQVLFTALSVCGQVRQP